MRWGLIFFGFLIVLAIAAIAGLLYRPATVIGVSDKSLAYSVRSEAGADKTGACRGRDDEYVCSAYAADSKASAGYAISVDDYGCWDGKRPPGGDTDLPEKLSGCITIVDLVR